MTNVYPDELVAGDPPQTKDGEAEEDPLIRYDRIFINDKSQLLRDLQPHDQIVRRRRPHDESGRRITRNPRVPAGNRPRTHQGGQGRRTALHAGGRRGRRTGQRPDGRRAARPRHHASTASRSSPASRSQLADLRPRRPRRRCTTSARTTGREATELAVERVVTAEGKIVATANRRRRRRPQLTLNVGTDEKPQLLTLPFAADCEITINGRRLVNEQLLKPADLRAGDKATVCARQPVGPRRRLPRAGPVGRDRGRALRRQDARRGPRKAARRPPTSSARSARSRSAASRPNWAICATATLVECDPRFARRGKPRGHLGRRPAARRPDPLGDPDRRSGLRGPLAEPAWNMPRPTPNCCATRWSIGTKCPADQAMLLTDESLVRLEQGIPDVLGPHRRRGQAGGVLRRPRLPGRRRQGVSGAEELRFPAHAAPPGCRCSGWSMQLEKCPAKEKLLLLDCSHAGKGADLAAEPSTAEMLQSLKAPPGRAAAADRHGHRQLQGRPARRRLAGETARPVRLAPGPRLRGRRRQEPRRPPGADRTVRLSPGGRWPRPPGN